MTESFDAVLAKVRRTANFCPSAERTTLHALLDSLAAAHAAEAKDAARYRLARNAATARNDIALCIAGRNGWEQLFGDDADAAIDAFLAEQALISIPLTAERIGNEG